MIINVERTRQCRDVYSSFRSNMSCCCCIAVTALVTNLQNLVGYRRGCWDVVVSVRLQCDQANPPVHTWAKVLPDIRKQPPFASVIGRRVTDIGKHLPRGSVYHLKYPWLKKVLLKGWCNMCACVVVWGVIVGSPLVCVRSGAALPFSI